MSPEMSSSKSQLMFTGLIVLLLAVIDVAVGSLPSSLKVCSRNETKINQCLVDAVEHIRTNLAKGDFGEDFNVPRVEPLFIEHIKMQNGRDLQAVVNQVNVSGCSAFKIEKIQSKPMNLSFDIGLSIPRLNFTGKYSLKMKLLLLNLQGKGDINGTLSKVRLAVRVRGYTEKIDGRQFVRFHRVGIRLKIENGHFQLGNLFNGDPVLGKVGNQVINENSRIFLDEMIPGLEKSLSKLFTAIANNLLYNATIDEMFPEKGEKGEKVEKVEQVDRVEKPEKVDKSEKGEKVEKVEKVEKIDKVEKPEKVDKSEKGEKEEKVEKVEKVDKEEKPEKVDKSEKDEKAGKDDNSEKDEKVENPKKAVEKTEKDEKTEKVEENKKDEKTDKVDKSEKDEKVEKSENPVEKPDKDQKTEKTEKSDKDEKANKGNKSEKDEKVEKSDKSVEKTEKPNEVTEKADKDENVTKKSR